LSTILGVIWHSLWGECDRVKTATSYEITYNHFAFTPWLSVVYMFYREFGVWGYCLITFKFELTNKTYYSKQIENTISMCRY